MINVKNAKSIATAKRALKNRKPETEVVVKDKVPVKELARASFMKMIASNWTPGYEPVSDHTYAADGWSFVGSAGSIPYSVLCKDLNAIGLELPTPETPGVHISDELKNDNAQVLMLTATGNVADIRIANAVIVMVVAPHLAAKFEESPHFFTVPADWKPKEKMN